MGTKPKIKTLKPGSTKSNLNVQTLCEKFDLNLKQIKPDLSPNTIDNTGNIKLNLKENSQAGQIGQIENKVNFNATIQSTDDMHEKVAPISIKCHQENVLNPPKIRPIASVKLPNRFSDIYQSDVVRLPDQKNLPGNKVEDIEGNRKKKKGRRKKEDGLALVNVRSIREYFSREERTGIDSNGKRKLQMEVLDENKKMKVVLPD